MFFSFPIYLFFLCYFQKPLVSVLQSSANQPTVLEAHGIFILLSRMHDFAAPPPPFPSNSTFPIFSFCIAFIFLYPTPLGFNYIFFHLNTTTGFIVERHRMCWGSIMIHLAAYFLKQQVFWGSVILHDKGNMHGRSYKQSNLDPVHIILVHVSMGFQDYFRSNGIWSYL